jgi:hypothetical protein
MPGQRLTQQDRGLIASALAEGHPYAEIARHLGRPTSTISREVTRNGGPDGYRADHAHEATERRSRQRKPPRTRAVGLVADVDGRDPEAVRRFEERFTAVVVQTGLPRMAARVLTCLYACDGGSFTAAELIQRLRVSAASISKAVGYLEGLRLVRREPGPGARQRYVIDDDVWSRAWSESARANAAWGEVSRYGAEVLGPDTPAGARLAGMGRFFERLSEDMGGGVDMAEAYDALTVLAALVHAARPLPADALATALGWPAERVVAALRCAAEHADIAGAVTVRSAEPGFWTVVANPAHLTAAQRVALDPLQAPTE